MAGPAATGRNSLRSSPSGYRWLMAIVGDKRIAANREARRGAWLQRRGVRRIPAAHAHRPTACRAACRPVHLATPSSKPMSPARRARRFPPPGRRRRQWACRARGNFVHGAHAPPHHHWERAMRAPVTTAPTPVRAAHRLCPRAAAHGIPRLIGNGAINVLHEGIAGIDDRARATCQRHPSSGNAMGNRELLPPEGTRPPTTGVAWRCRRARPICAASARSATDRGKNIALSLGDSPAAQRPGYPIAAETSR